MICPGRANQLNFLSILLRSAEPEAENPTARKPLFIETHQSDLGRPVSRAKIFCFQFHLIAGSFPPSRARKRGVSRSSRTLGAGRWQENPVTGESTKETVKTIAQGRPDQTGEPVVTMLVCFFNSHARLRVQRAPGFPCALFLGE